MLKLLLGLVMLSAPIASACSDYCLRCDASQTCLFCDASSGFALNAANGCQKLSDSNCAQFDAFGNCLVCAADYFLDLNSRKCTQVVSPIANCKLYFSQRTCLVCLPGFGITNGSCGALAVPIANCLNQQNNVCLQCESRYVPSLKGDACKEVSSTQANCAFQQSVECVQCASGYVLNYNYYLTQILGFQYTHQQNLLASFITKRDAGDRGAFALEVCQQGQVANCLAHVDATTCGRCETGYFVNGVGACELWPIEPVAFCEAYSSLKVCIRCKGGFRLTQNGNCSSQPVIPNCRVYITDSAEYGCRLCEPGFRLLSLYCVPRDFPIEKCAEMNETGDQCKVCAAGFAPTSDRLKCLPFIENCSVYFASDFYSTALVCRACAPTFNVEASTGKCVAGALGNCLNYNDASTTCASCVNRFFLRDQACLEQPVVNGCEAYHPLASGICSSCKTGSIRAIQQISCENPATIPACAVYRNSTNCAQCQDGYTLVSTNQCILIPPAENCLQKTDNYCTKCLPNFINDFGTCRQPLDSVVINCNKSNIDGVVLYDQNTCDSCNANSFPWDYKESFVCTEIAYAQNTLGITYSTDCLQYRLVGSAYLCVKCIETKFTSPTGVCLASCPVTNTIYRQTVVGAPKVGNNFVESLFVEQINYCGAKITNCAVAAPDMNQPNPITPRYACVQCDNDSLPVVDSVRNSYSLVRFPMGTVAQRTGVSPVSFTPGLICVNPTTNAGLPLLPTAVDPPNNIRLLGSFDPTTRRVENCDYYGLIDLGVGCVKCRHGFNGVSLNVVNQCFRYSGRFECIECNQGYYLAKAFECKPVNPIFMCVTYSPTAVTTTCTLCATGYYLDSNACLRRIRSLSVANSVAKPGQDSIDCIDGYTRVPDLIASFPGGAADPTVFVCRPNPQNCVTVTAFVGFAFPSTCSVCNTAVSYRTAANLCVVGTIANCRTYISDGATVNTCQTCAAGFYKSGTLCLPHTPTVNPNCKDFDLTVKDKCSVCKAGYSLFVPTNRCQATLNIVNCTSYASVDTCATCASGFRLSNRATQCTPIPVADNCVVSLPVKIDLGSTLYTDNDRQKNGEFIYNCAQCQSSFYRIEQDYAYEAFTSPFTPGIVRVGVCVSWMTYKTQNCALITPEGPSDYRKLCATCNTSFYPRDFTGLAICIDRSYHLANTPAAHIANCARLEVNGGGFKCTECAFGYVLNSGRCDPECPTAGETFFVADVTKVASSGDVAGYFQPKVAACAAEPIVGCRIASPFMLDYTVDATAVDYGCTSCRAGYAPQYQILTSTASRTNPVYVDGLTSNVVRSPFDAFPSIELCVDESTVAYADSDTTYSTTAIPNCRHFTFVATVGTIHVMGCISCSKFYQGVIRYFNGGSIGIITSCTTFPSGSSTGACNTASALNEGIGLRPLTNVPSTHAPLSMFYSCYACAVATEIPAISMLLNADGSFAKMQQWNVAETTPVGTTTLLSASAVSSNNICVANSNFIANCGLGLFNTGYDTGVASSVKTICTACKPGYTPTYDVNKRTITACTEITNCPASSTWFNTCSTCTFAYDYVNKQVNYAKCLATTTASFLQGCFSGYLVGSENREVCLLCRKGYELDPNGVCQRPLVAGCDAASFSNTFKNFAAKMHIGKVEEFIVSFGNLGMYYLSSGILGCTSCDSTKILTTMPPVTTVDTNLQQMVCVPQSLVPASTYAVPNCVQYNTNTTLSCGTCAAGYVLVVGETSVGSAVFRGNCRLEPTKREFENCLQAVQATTTQCTLCKDNTFLLVGGYCLARSSLDANCKTFSDLVTATQDSPVAICLECNSGYYLDTSLCRTIPARFTNCAVYDPNLDLCTRCKDSYVLATIAGGVSTCLSTNIASTFDANCAQYDPINYAASQLTCQTCKPGFFLTPALAPANFCVGFISLINTACLTYSVPIVGQPLSASTLKCTACVNRPTHFLDESIGDCVARAYLDANCGTYHEKADECLTCRDNYALEPTLRRTCRSILFSSPYNPLNKSYLHSCTAMTTCVQTTFYEGLSPKLSRFVSCHSCANTGQIPFLYGRGGSPFTHVQGLGAFGLNVSGTQRLSDLFGDTSMKCLSPTAASLNIDAAKFSFPANCGLGFVNVNSLPDSSTSTSLLAVDRAKIAAMCVACAPRFSATGGSDANGPVPDLISSCTAIENCQASTWFNYCSQCSPGFTYRYDPNTGIRFDRCVSAGVNPNCYALDLVSASVPICRYCNPGYTLNIDGICEMIRPPRCFINNNRFKEINLARDLNVGAFLGPEGPGCQQCDSGFVGVYNEGSKQLCTQSLYIGNNTVTAGSAFIYGCVNYVVTQSEQLICRTCAPGFTLTYAGRCLQAPSKPACSVVFDIQNCAACTANSTALVNHDCIMQTIPNCQEYANSFLHATSVCKTCNPGFSLHANRCIPSIIENCAVSDDERRCAICMPGFQRIRVDKLADYCLPTDPTLNCATLDPVSLQKGKLVCTECANPSKQFLSDKPALPNACLSGYLANNCKVFATREPIGASTFSCTQCIDSFYLNADSKCTARGVFDVRCSAYDIRSDTCLACVPGSYLRTDGKACLDYPNGIAGCEVYRFTNECGTCAPDFYLSKKICLAVPEELLIAQCIYYASEKACSVCANGYVVFAGQCVAALAQNCLTYLSQSACSTCNPGFGLRSVNGLINCVPIEKPNCETTENVYPFTCLVCSPGHYMSGGDCLAPSASISGCTVYASDTTCSKCQTGTVLAADGSSCITVTTAANTLDAQCNIAEEKTLQQCVACELGYYFENGACTKCQIDTSTCLGCRENAPTICAICKSGFHMNQAGRCVANGDTATNVTPAQQISYLSFAQHTFFR